MDRRVSSDELNELLSNSSWVRNLAVRLLADNHQAEDVVQDVWLTALTQPPRQRQALPAWLKKVASNVARKKNRSEARRRAREEQRVPTPPVVPPDIIVERLELQGRVAQAVMQLTEPYRDVVYLRFYVGLPHKAIAEQLQRRESTVRTQLARGLELLRETLDSSDLQKRSGGWRGAFAIVFMPELQHIAQSAAAAASGWGWLPRGVQRAMRLAIPGVAVVVLLLLLTGDVAPTGTSVAASSPRHQPRTAGTSASEETGLARAGVHARPDALQSGSAQADTRDLPSAPATAGPSDQDGAEQDAGTDSAGDAALIRVVDRTGQPVPDATVELFVTGTVAAVTTVTTDPDGAGTVPRANLARSALRIVAEGFVEYEEPTILRSLDGDTPYVIELEETFPGLVRIFYPDGAPAVGVTVEVRADQRTHPQATPELVKTDNSGEATFWFRYQQTQLAVAVPGHATVGVPAQRATTEITLTAGVHTIGHATTADGAPLRDCLISITTPRSRPNESLTRTDSYGTFDMGNLAPDETVTVRLYPPERPPFKTEGLPPEGGTDWWITVPESRHAEGRILASADAAATDAVVFVTTPQSSPQPRRGGSIPSFQTDLRNSRYHRARTRLVPLRRTRPDADGWFGIDYVIDANETCYLLIHHPHLVNRVLAIAPGETQQTLPTIQLDRGEPTCGRVVSPDGTPLPGVVLHLGEKWSNDMESVLGRARTDANGEFCFDGVPRVTHESLTGSSAEAPIHRSEIFVTAFAPDLLLAGNGETLAESTIPDSFVLTPGVHLELIATDRGQLVDLDMEIDDIDGAPLTAWIPALWIAGSEYCHGVVGPRAGRHVFVGERGVWTGAAATEGAEPNGPGDTRGGDLLLMPPHARWTQVSLRDDRPRSVALTMRAPTRASITLSGEQTQGRAYPRQLAVGIPFGHEQAAHIVGDGGAPVAWLVLGAAEPGTRELPPLPDGRFTVVTIEPGVPTTLYRASPAGSTAVETLQTLEIQAGAVHSPRTHP